MTLDFYGHVFGELEDAEPVSAEELTAEGARRKTRVRPRCDLVAARQPNGKQTPH
jgi:hypothetical protein